MADPGIDVDLAESCALPTGISAGTPHTHLENMETAIPVSPLL